MTDNEIVRGYLEAKNRDKQIGIPCDLTGRKEEDIVEVLRKGGAMGTIRSFGAAQKKWTPEREKELVELGNLGLKWKQIAEKIGGTRESVSMHYYAMQKPKHIPKAEEKPAEVVQDTPCPVGEDTQKTSAFGFENIVSVLMSGEFDTVTFENAEVSVTVRRKAT